MGIGITPDGRWYVRIQENKKRTRKYFGHGDLAEARARAYQEELDALRGKGPQTSIPTHTILDKYHKDALVEPLTRKMDKYKIIRLIAILGDIPSESLTKTHLTAYRKKRLQQGAGLATIKNEIGRLKAAFSWAEDQDPPLLLSNRIHKFKIGRVGERNVPLPPTTKELKAVLAKCRPHVCRAILLARYCGMRPGPRELFRITWNDVDWESRELRVPCAHKSGLTYRMVPIHRYLYSQMLDWHKADSSPTKIKRLKGLSFLQAHPNLTIVHYYGKPVKSIKKAWAAALDNAKITRRIRPYDLRHAFATQALRSGGDLKSTSQIIGHSRPDTTIREYQHVTLRDHRRVVDLAPDFSGAILGPPDKNTAPQHTETKRKSKRREPSQV